MSVSFDPERVTLVDHPLVQHKLSILRDKRTGTKQFRDLIGELALFEGYEATRDLPLEDVQGETPICAAPCRQLSGRKLAIVPILRAGLGMVDGLLELIPAARVGHPSRMRVRRFNRTRRLGHDAPVCVDDHGTHRCRAAVDRHDV